mgnify:CR=1 FL=1
MDTFLIVVGLIEIAIGLGVGRVVIGLNSIIRKQDALMKKLIEIKNR